MINPDDFLKQAEEFVNDEKNREGYTRSGVSRAYYSLYHQTFNHLRVKHARLTIMRIELYLKRKSREYDKTKLERFDPEYMKELGMHSIIPVVLLEFDRDIAKDFKLYREARVKADYKINDEFEQNDAITIVNQVKTLIGKICAL
ncbi:MAG: hypothetical protein ACYDAJ_09060 [Nitrosotalea sp.]